MPSATQFFIEHEKSNVYFQFERFKMTLAQDKTATSYSSAIEAYEALQKHVNNFPARMYCQAELQRYCKKTLIEAQNKLKKIGILLSREQLQIRSMADSKEITKITKKYLKAIKDARRSLKFSNARINPNSDRFDMLANEIEAFLASPEGEYASFLRIGILRRNLKEEHTKFVHLVRIVRH